MEVKKIKILTAIGNPILNNELKKIEDIEVINNDIQYQEGIFEILEIEKEIDFIIIRLIPGKLEICELIEKVEEVNYKIKIVLILEKYDEKLEKILIKKGVYRIFYNNKIEVGDFIKILNEDSKMEKYNEEIRKEIDELKKYIKSQSINEKINSDKKIVKNKLNKNKKFYKKEKNDLLNIVVENIKNNLLNKKIFLNILDRNEKKHLINKIIDNKQENNIISVLGNSGAGKSVFSVLLANTLKRYYNKILIIDFDFLNNSLHTILGVRKYSEEIKEKMKNTNFDKNKIEIQNLIINVNKKIDLISGINLIFDSSNKINQKKMKEIIKEVSKLYNVVIIDTTTECFFEYTQEIIKMSNKSIFLTEANLLEISKSKRILEMYYTNWNIEKNKINIIFNKFNKNSIDVSLLYKLYSDYKILGRINLKKDYNKIIKSNIKCFKNNNLLKKIGFIKKEFIQKINI